VQPVLGYEIVGTVDSTTTLSGTFEILDGTSFSMPCCTLNLTWSASLPAPPDAPTSLTGTAYATPTVELAWTDNAGDETEYRVERKLESDVSFTQIDTLAPDATDYSDDTVRKGMQYVYRVMACNAQGCSDPSNEATVTVPAMGFFIGN
jgi:titin